MLLQIVAQEYLTPELYEGRTEVTVRLEDINDNWPEFSQDVYNASIYENSAFGTVVTTITVSSCILSSTSFFPISKYSGN
jgi:hypothetical protein